MPMKLEKFIEFNFYNTTYFTNCGHASAVLGSGLYKMLLSFILFQRVISEIAPSIISKF